MLIESIDTVLTVFYKRSFDMKKKSVLAIMMVLVLCFASAGCSILGIGGKKKKDKDKVIDPPSDRSIIKAVEAEYDGDGDWEITDDDEDDGDYTWELECEDGATAVVTWSEGDDEDDLDIDIDDSGVIVETEPEPTDDVVVPDPTTSSEPDPVQTTASADFPDALNGFDQYFIVDYSLGINSINWSGAEISSGLAIYDIGDELTLEFNCQDQNADLYAHIYKYPLANDEDPDANQNPIDSEFYAEVIPVTMDSEGNCTVSCESMDEAGMYIFVISTATESEPDYSYFYTACFAD